MFNEDKIEKKRKLTTKNTHTHSHTRINHKIQLNKTDHISNKCREFDTHTHTS